MNFTRPIGLGKITRQRTTAARERRLPAGRRLRRPRVCCASARGLTGPQRSGDLSAGHATIGIGSAAGFDEVVQRSPGRWDIPISPSEFGVDDRALPWWPLIAAVLGDNAEHSFSGVVYSDPGTPAQCWHIDSPHVSSDHLPPHALNVMVALHDTPLTMGPTELARARID